MKWNAILAGAALALAACGTPANDPAGGADATDTAAVTDTAAPSPGGVERETTQREASPIERVAAEAIASQPGPDGSQVDLMSARVTGDILTVTMRCSSADRINTETFNLEQVSVIDDATSQRIGVLKDDEGNWMASDVSGRLMRASCETKPGVMWARFPAPPASSPTISISLPGVAPFDGVAVQR